MKHPEWLPIVLKCAVGDILLPTVTDGKELVCYWDSIVSA
jgi:hypothetical protein